MKITKFITAITSMIVLFFHFDGNGQTWNFPVAGSTTSTYIGTTSANDVIINSGAPSAERMRILGSGTNNGFVGIGTSSPSANLHVAGNSIIGIPSVYTPGTPLTVQKCLYGGIGGGHGTVATFNLNTAGGCANYYNLNVVDFNTPGGAWDFGSGYLNGSIYNAGWKKQFSISGTGQAFFGDHLTLTSSPAQLTVNGNAIIGDPTTPTPAGYNLYVSTGILTEKLKVAVKGTANWSDFVFEKNYKLTPLHEIEVFISKNKHLPGIPSAQDVVDNGINVAEMDAKLLMKIEELTLYTIEQEKQIEALKSALLNSKNEYSEMMKMIQELKTQFESKK